VEITVCVHCVSTKSAVVWSIFWEAVVGVLE